jgi:hypothetical protein
LHCLAAVQETIGKGGNMCGKWRRGWLLLRRRRRGRVRCELAPKAATDGAFSGGCACGKRLARHDKTTE